VQPCGAKTEVYVLHVLRKGENNLEIGKGFWKERYPLSHLMSQIEDIEELYRKDDCVWKNTL